VPKLQAVKNIIAMPGNYGITLPRVDNQPYFVTIAKTRDIDIAIAAELAELPIDEFKALNPQFNRPVITGSTNTQILLPQSNAEKFKTNLAKWGHTLSSWTAHKVTNARERIETIAAKFRTTPEVIREANNIPPKMRLKAGSTILVPKSEDAGEADIARDITENATMAIEPDGPASKHIFVKVGKRDSLASIARRHRVTVAQIKAWNGLSRDTIGKGQRLELYVPYRMATKKGAKQAANSRQPKKGTKASKTKVVKASKMNLGKTILASAKPSSIARPATPQ
jgi:membrane-bound lytic murein transglycosylase D